MRLQEEGFLTQLYRGVKAALLVRIFGVGMAFVVQMLLARWFGPEVFGEYIYVFTWITVLALIAKLGLDTASLKFVSAYAGLKQWDLLEGFIRKSRCVVFLASFLISGIGLATFRLTGEWGAPGLASTFQFGLLLLPCMALMQLHAAHVQALKHPGQAQIPQDVVRPLILLAGASLFAGLNYMPSSAMVMGVDILATLVGLIVAWHLLTKRLQDRIAKVTAAVYCTRDWLVVSLPMLMVSGAQLVLAKADILMVGAMIGATEAGKYAVASLLAGLVTFIISTANQVIAPTISQLFAQGRQSELQRMVTVSTVVLSVLTLPLVLSLTIFGSDLLGLFGMDFIDQYDVLLVLMAGQIVIVLWGSVGFLLTMTEHQTMALWVIGISSLLNVVLNAIFIPPLGVMGAALATTVSVSLRSIVLGFLVWKKLRVMPTVFGPVLRRLVQAA